MNTTQPIRNKKKLEEFKNYYKTGNIRNYTLIIVSLNTALRINDVLHLTYEDVYVNGKVNDYIIIKERKTGKINRIYLNHNLKNALRSYRKYLIKTKCYQNGNHYLFASPRKTGAPLSRYQAYRIVKADADAIQLEGTISCHSMRKTFGYHAWKQGKDPVVIMTLFNHSSFRVTRRYLCLEQDDKDQIFKEIKI